MFEDFNNYVKVDPNSRIKINKTEIESQMVKNEIVWLYKDMGKDYFGDFKLNLATMYLDSNIDPKDQTSYNHFASWENAIESMHIQVLNGKPLIYVLWYKFKNENKPRLEIKQMKFKNDVPKWSGFLEPNTWYYLTIEKLNKVFSLAIYKDPERKQLMHKLQIELTENFRFQYFVASQCYQLNRNSWLKARSKDYEWK